MNRPAGGLGLRRRADYRPKGHSETACGHCTGGRHRVLAQKASTPHRGQLHFAYHLRAACTRQLLVLAVVAQTPTPDGADQLLPILEVVWYKLLGEERKIGNAVKKSIPKQKNVSKKQFLIKQGVKNNEILRTWDRWRRSPSPPPKPEKKGRPGQSHHFDPRKMEKSYIKFKATELPE